jgi:hypothetical protein
MISHYTNSSHSNFPVYSQPSSDFFPNSLNFPSYVDDSKKKGREGLKNPLKKPNEVDGVSLRVGLD